MKNFIFIFLTLWLTACTTKALPLAEYEGQYEYVNDSTLIIVAGPERQKLYAVINEARYPLRPFKKDIFLNNGDVEVEFVRDTSQKIIGYQENKAADGSAKTLFSLLDADQTLPPSIWFAKPEGASIPYLYRAPKDMSDGLQIRVLEDNNLLATHLSNMTNAIYNESYPNTESALIYQNGTLVYEEYFYDYDKSRPHQLRSATKTYIALLAGIAVDQGLMSRDDLVLPFFPEYDDLQHIDNRKRSITIDNLLTMQSGFECDDRNSESAGNESKFYFTDDWARFVLDLPMSHDPGTFGSYCSGNVKVLGRIIEKVSGKALKAFADEHLFQPLGITNYEWNHAQDSSNAENFGQIWMRPRDMLKIGVLISDEGVWHGRRIITQDWIKDLTSPQSTIGETPYGYLYWQRYFYPNGKDRIEIPQLSGNGGQKVIILKEQNAIVVLTGRNYNQASHTRELLADHILKGFGLDTERQE